MLRRGRARALATTATALAALIASALAFRSARAQSQPAWEQWVRLPGVYDLAGPRRDGRLVAAVHSGLVLLSPSGATAPFAPGYSAPDGSESYIALSPGLSVDGAGCRFARDEVLALDLRGTPPGVARIAPDGAVSHLADLPGASSLSGIALDTVGRFGHRLLVIGPGSPGTTRVATVDCRGRVSTVGVVATPLEGGISVAPRGFGPYGGELVAADEAGGSIYAVSPAGRLSTVVASGVPAGADTGVESAGFVPARAAAAYLADRGTPGNPHPGTDSVLRLTGAALAGAGVRAGDLLVGTEGGATVVRVRCAPACAATVAATGPPVAHGEGRLLLVAVAGGGGSKGLTAGVIVALVLAASGGWFARARRRRSRPAGKADDRGRNHQM